MNPCLRLLLPLLFAACSMLGSGAPEVSQDELIAMQQAKADFLLLDVRTPGEFGDGHISGAMHIDHRDIEERIGGIEPFRQKPVVVYCLSGMRAGMVEACLIEHGFTQVKHLAGDWSAWESAKLPVAR